MTGWPDNGVGGKAPMVASGKWFQLQKLKKSKKIIKY